jgi:hypothetical protein
MLSNVFLDVGTLLIQGSIYIYNFSHVLVIHYIIGIHLSSRFVHKLLLGFCYFFHISGSFGISIRDIFCTSLYILSKYIKILSSKLPLMACNYINHLSGRPSFSDFLFVRVAYSRALVIHLTILLIHCLFYIFSQSIF